MNARFFLDAASGLLTGAPYRPSPHADDRPAGCAPELVVIHGISLPPGVWGGEDVERLFLGTLDCTSHPAYAELRGVRVSAHLYLRRDGTVVQFVPVHRRAWHAGASRFAARGACNDFSIGIELEGSDRAPYADAQYVCLAAAVRALRAAFPAITPERLVGHDEIAPGRKTDPGPYFDWARLRAGVSA